MSHYFYITPEEYQAAEQNGISAHLLGIRVRDLAWKKDRAISTPPRVVGNLVKWRDAAMANGIRANTFYTRLRRGISPEEASTTPLMSMCEASMTARDKNRVHPAHYVALAKENGVKYKTYTSRIHRGWDPEQAATKSVDAKHLPKAKRN